VTFGSSNLTPYIVEDYGGGGGKRERAAGNKELAAQLGVNVRTVQRWQKEPGTGEARNAARSTQAPALQRRAAEQHIRAAGVDVEPCETQVHVYNEARSRPRTVAGKGRNALHISGEQMGDVLDELAAGHDVAAAAAFGDAWLGAYGMDVDATITDVGGSLNLSY